MELSSDGENSYSVKTTAWAGSISSHVTASIFLDGKLVTGYFILPYALHSNQLD